jgi:hypothetical protein
MTQLTDKQLYANLRLIYDGQPAILHMAQIHALLPGHLKVFHDTMMDPRTFYYEWDGKLLCASAPQGYVMGMTKHPKDEPEVMKEATTYPCPFPVTDMTLAQWLFGLQEAK